MNIYPQPITSPRHTRVHNRATSIVEQENDYFNENAKKVSTHDLMLKIARNRVNFNQGLKLED